MLAVPKSFGQDRVNSRNGYRGREWDTRAGTVEVAIPRLRTGSYFPDSQPNQGGEVLLAVGADQRGFSIRLCRLFVEFTVRPHPENSLSMPVEN